jgi:hypothetical protein
MAERFSARREDTAAERRFEAAVVRVVSFGGRRADLPRRDRGAQYVVVDDQRIEFERRGERRHDVLARLGLQVADEGLEIINACA